MTKKQRKTLHWTSFLLGLLFQFPLIVALQFGVHFLTGLSILWCIPIAVVLCLMYDVGGMICGVKNERNYISSNESTIE